MASYITAKNQEMLWKTIQKNPLFGQILTPEQQPIWFREIIGNFYNENVSIIIDTKSLLDVNKNTLKYMVHDLKKRITNVNRSQQQFKNPLDQPINDRIQPQSSSYQSEYDALQNNYNSMHQRKVPKEPNFKENIDDDKITNMDELIQQQLKERELDSIPKPPVQPNNETTSFVETKSQLDKPKSNIQMQIKDITIEELKIQIDSLMQRTSLLEKELTEVRSQLVSDSSNSQIIIHQMNDSV